MASWETIKSQIGKVTNKVVAKTGEVADTASKHVKLKTIEGNLSEKYELLGRLAYKHIKGVEVPEEKVNALTSEIAALISEKKHIKAEIEADKAKKAAEKQAKKDAKAAEEAEEAAAEIEADKAKKAAEKQAKKDAKAAEEAEEAAAEVLADVIVEEPAQEVAEEEAQAE